ncbi:MAG: hypothetical protein M1831_004924 [Alyxoria varia]|nr:MAG: hypothetical protein M1831_004924 [Alyxoria varia]
MPSQAALERAKLEPGGLYVVLFLRGDPNPKDEFHWGLYLHQNDQGGTKYHIKNMASGWICEHAYTTGVFVSNFLVGLIQIARVPSSQVNYVDTLLRSYDNRLNESWITCRTWTFALLPLLQQRQQNGFRILQCDNLSQLEREIKDWGNANAKAATNNVQPRPFATSNICGL